MKFHIFSEYLRDLIGRNQLDTVVDALVEIFEDVECDFRKECLLLKQQLMHVDLYNLNGFEHSNFEIKHARIVNSICGLLDALGADSDFEFWFNRGRLNMRMLSLDDRVLDQDIYVLRDIILGRSKECDVMIDDPSISSEHARISFADRRVWIEDLESTNGTYLDNDFLVGRSLLSSGCIITVADVSFRVEINYDYCIPFVLSALR